MALSLSGVGPRGPRRGAKGSCGTPGTPWVISPGDHRAILAVIEVDRALAGPDQQLAAPQPGGLDLAHAVEDQHLGGTGPLSQGKVPYYMVSHTTRHTTFRTIREYWIKKRKGETGPLSQGVQTRT
jgi:hypothetical protein